MKYKTNIRIITEAMDKNEAIEIVDEYLSGNIMSGVEMRCATSPNVNYKTPILCAALFSLLVISGLLITATTRTPSVNSSITPVSSAIQPALKTSTLPMNEASFKMDWQNKQVKEALEYIKR